MTTARADRAEAYAETLGRARGKADLAGAQLRQARQQLLERCPDAWAHTIADHIAGAERLLWEIQELRVEDAL